MVDRFEDITPPEKVHADNKCDRKVTLYGYLRGCNLKKGHKVCSPVLLYHCLCLYQIILEDGAFWKNALGIMSSIDTRELRWFRAITFDYIFLMV